MREGQGAAVSWARPPASGGRGGAPTVPAMESLNPASPQRLDPRPPVRCCAQQLHPPPHAPSSTATLLPQLRRTAFQKVLLLFSYCLGTLFLVLSFHNAGLGWGANGVVTALLLAGVTHLLAAPFQHTRRMLWRAPCPLRAPENMEVRRGSAAGVWGRLDLGEGQGCVRRAGASEVAPEAV